MISFAPCLPPALAFGGAAINLLAWRSVAHLKPWHWQAGLIFLAFAFGDWALMGALPLLGLSFGPPTTGFMLAFWVRMLLALLPVAAIKFVQTRKTQMGGNSSATVHFLLLIAVNLLALALEAYALYYEPFNLQTTHLAYAGFTVQADRPLRIVHLSDLHVERITPRERRMIETVDSLQPDLILLTGDYLNLDYLSDERALQEARTVLGQLHAPYGVFAVNGSVDSPPRMARLYAGLDITVLDDEIEHLDLPVGELYLVGISNIYRPRDAEMLRGLMAQLPAEASTVLLYHTPDLIETAAATGVDLYLAGHTHGGQVRLPFYGAVVTFSEYGKQYEAGEYRLGETILYVSRGLGLEGFGLPRVRFLCPPEIALIELSAE